MTREILKISKFNDSIINAVHGIKYSQEPLVFRNGLELGDANQWLLFLRDSCGLEHDKRHYTSDAKMMLSDWWEVSYQPDKATSYAYSKTRQPLHTDNAWFSNPAELNFFIMKKQANKGGEETIYPLERLMNDLYSLDKTLYNDLCSIPVIIKKGDGKYFNKTTIIVENNNPKIFWNYYRVERQSQEVDMMCEAFFQFLETREATSSIERLYCNSGDCFVFNDLKMLHGRAAFEASKPYDRILYQSMWKFS